MDLTGVILLTGIGLVVGFLVAALIFQLRKESATVKESKKQLLSDAENKVRLWREGGEKHLVVEMRGVSYRQESKLQAEEKQVLEELVNELQAWLGTSTAKASAAAQKIKNDLAPSRPAPTRDTSGTSLNPLKIFGDALQPQKKTENNEQEQSIVAQIDQILQTKLEGTDLEDEGIRLVEGPDQGMVIEIGLDRYNEIEIIPDEAVRQVIRESVADWETNLGD